MLCSPSILVTSTAGWDASKRLFSLATAAPIFLRLLAIFQDLAQHGYDLFMAFTGIASGDFERVILETIEARAHFLVLLTPSALECCVDPADGRAALTAQEWLLKLLRFQHAPAV